MVSQRPKKEKEFEFPKHLYVDAGLFLTYVVSFILDFTIRVEFPNKTILTEMVKILLPAVVTIISVSLQLGSEKIHGVSRIEFNKLKSSWHYDVFSMIIVVCVVFALFTVSYFFNLQLSIICLDVISLIYSVLFSVMEIPALMSNEKVIQSILRDFAKRTRLNNYEPLTETENIFRKMAINYITSNGLFSTFKMLKNDDKDNQYLIDYLLRQEEEHLKGIVFDNAISRGGSNEFEGVFIIDEINRAFKNLREVLVENRFEELSVKCTNPSGEVEWYIPGWLFKLHRIDNQLSLEEKEKEELDLLIDGMITNLQPSISTHKMVCSFMNEMVILGLQEGKTWFSESIRDLTSYKKFFEEDYMQIGWFYLIYCHYLVTYNKDISCDVKNNIKKLIDTKSKSINSDGSTWKGMAQLSFENSSSYFLNDMLPSLLSVYDSSNEGLFVIFNPERNTSLVTEDDKQFDESFVVDAWLELVLFDRDCERVRLFDLAGILSKLNVKWEIILRDEFNKKWRKRKNDELFTKPAFMSFLGFTFAEKELNLFINESIRERLEEWCNSAEVKNLVYKEPEEE